MRLESVSPQSPGQRAEGPARPAQPEGRGGVPLSEGDVVQAKVIAGRGEVLSLKTAEGLTFHARLEAGLRLPVGTDALLVVTREEGGVLYMALAESAPAAASASATQAADMAVLRALAAMGLRASAETLQAAQELLSAHPALGAEKAAFLAGNKLPAEPFVLRALDALFSGKADTAAILTSLSAASEAGGAPQPVPPQTMPVPEQAASVPAQSAAAEPAVPAQNEAAEPKAAVPAQGVAAEQSAAARTELPRFDGWLPGALREGAATVAEALSQSPAFAGLPARSLAHAAETLERVAASVPEPGGEGELLKSIAKFAAALFLRPGDGAEELAAKLKSVREELYVKLAYFRDAAAASDAPAKGLVLEQTQRLMDHVRLLSAPEQFICLQLPILNGQGRENAELYIYKRERNGSQRLDPEDAKILLVLDLMHMGHLEALVEIKGKEVSLRFEVETEDAATVFKNHTTKLHKLLDTSGYKFTNSQVSTKKRDTTPETALLTLLSHEESMRAGLDYTV